MSVVSRILDRLKSIPGMLTVWGDVRELVAKNSPALYAVLEAMAADNWRGAALAFLRWGSVVDVVAHTLRIGEDAAKVLLGTAPVVEGATRAFERIDALVNEEKAIALMELLRLPREAPA